MERDYIIAIIFLMVFTSGCLQPTSHSQFGTDYSEETMQMLEECDEEYTEEWSIKMGIVEFVCYITRFDVSGCWERKETFREKCYVDVAVASNEISICDKLHSRVIKTYCYGEMIKATNDSSICKRDIDPDFCYYWVMTQTNDTSFCTHIKNQTTRNECYYFENITLAE